MTILAMGGKSRAEVLGKLSNKFRELLSFPLYRTGFRDLEDLWDTFKQHRWSPVPVYHAGRLVILVETIHADSPNQWTVYVPQCEPLVLEMFLIQKGLSV